jgi:hypothetical protein
LMWIVEMKVGSAALKYCGRGATKTILNLSHRVPRKWCIGCSTL